MKKTMRRDGECRNNTFPCENIVPYQNGEKRLAHTEVKCVVCGKKWLWGLSWDGSMDGKFICDYCKNKVANKNKPMKKLYKFEIVETMKYFVEVEANTREEADELAVEVLDEAVKYNRVDGFSRKSLDTDWSLVSAEKIEEEPADEDLVREGSPVEEE